VLGLDPDAAEPGLRAVVLQGDVPLLHLREQRPFTELAARDPLFDLFTPQVVAEHLRVIDPVLDLAAADDEPRTVIRVGDITLIAPRRDEAIERTAGSERVGPILVMLVIEQLHLGPGLP